MIEFSGDRAIGNSDLSFLTHQTTSGYRFANPRGLTHVALKQLSEVRTTRLVTSGKTDFA